VVALRNQLLEVTALHSAGHYSRGLDLATRVLGEARALGYRPVVAEALYRLGELQLDTGQVAAASTLEQAFWTAQASAHDELSAEVAVENIYIAGYQQHDMPQAQRWMSQSEALLERIGGHEQLRGWMLNNLAAALYAAGRNEESAAEYFKALQIKERLLGKDHPDVANTLNNLADQLRVLGRAHEAVDFSNRAVDIIDHTFGPWHPAMAGMLETRADIFNQLGRYQEARQDAERAVVIEEQELGSDRSRLVFALEPLGDAYLGLGTPKLAIAPLERGIELAQNQDDLAAEVSRVRFSLARALWESNEDRPRAIRLASAVAKEKARPGAPLQEQIRRRALAWLASRDTATGARR
jgi:serine/threonine-protein kinase